MYHSTQNKSTLSRLIDSLQSFSMDISLSNKKNGTQIEPKTVHGILWLQTHFESKHWELLSNGLVIIPSMDAQMLGKDATNAGLNVNFINSLSQIDKI